VVGTDRDPVVHITIAAVGKLRAGAEQQLISHYLKQCPWKITIHELADAPTSLASAARLTREATAFAPHLENSISVALDARGETLSSEAFAKLIAQAMRSGKKRLTFLIGGQDGLAPELVASATHRIAFGAMIWPHKLARVMLCEQLFRAHCILSNHPYHQGHA
jgi:23S rRNA (pseudouridine1915-N3)-methyltransferase